MTTTHWECFVRGERSDVEDCDTEQLPVALVGVPARPHIRSGAAAHARTRASAGGLAQVWRPETSWAAAIAVPRAGRLVPAAADGARAETV